MVTLEIIRRLTGAKSDVISEPYVVDKIVRNGSSHVDGDAVVSIIVT